MKLLNCSLDCHNQKIQYSTSLAKFAKKVTAAAIQNALEVHVAVSCIGKPPCTGTAAVPFPTLPSPSPSPDPSRVSSSPLSAPGSNHPSPPLAAGDHVQVRHHTHLLLLRGRRGGAPPRGRLPARLHLPRQGPRRHGAGHAPAVARARGPARPRPAPEPRRRLPPRARQPRPLRHELRHRRPRRRLPLPHLPPRLPHRLPRLHGRLAHPLLPPRRPHRPLRPRRRRRRRPRRARRRHARPPPAHRRDRQHPHVAAHRIRARPCARRSAQAGGQCRRGSRTLVRPNAAAAIALAT